MAAVFGASTLVEAPPLKHLHKHLQKYRATAKLLPIIAVLSVEEATTATAGRYPDIGSQNYLQISK